MKIRSLLLVAGVAATLAPATSQANQCDIPIYLFSRTRVQTDIDDPTTPANDPIGRNVPNATSSAIGCTPRDELGDDPTLEYFYNTTVVYPGSNRLSVRFLENGNDPSILTEATLTYAGVTHQLEMAPGVTVAGDPAPWMDSKDIVIDPATTLVPDTAVARICIDQGDDPDFCQEVTYWTVPAHPLPA